MRYHEGSGDPVTCTQGTARTWNHTDVDMQTHENGAEKECLAVHVADVEGEDKEKERE